MKTFLNSRFDLCSVKLVVFFCSAFSFIPDGFSQSNRIEETIIRIEESIKASNQDQLLKEVNYLYDTDTILPDVSAYYLGYVLLKSEELVASKRAFLRYIDLTKEEGDYMDSVVRFVNQIDLKLEQYMHDDCSICTVLGPLDELDTCNVCLGHGISIKDCQRCGGVGDEVCPVCRGSGFQTQQTQFYVNYVTCRTCLGVGQVECSRCQGDKKEKSACENCAGKGLKNKERICNHRDYEIPENSTTEKKTNYFSR